MAAPNSYKDAFWKDLAANAETQLGLPPGLLSSIVTKGEKSNNDQVSEAGAKTTFQIIPATRKAVLDKYGIDAYKSPEDAALAAGYLLKESLERNGGNVKTAVAEYHGGTDPKNWGPRTRAYVGRVLGDESNIQAASNNQPVADGPLQSTFDKVLQQMQSDKANGAGPGGGAGASGKPPSLQLNITKPEAITLPQSVTDAYINGSLSNDQRAQLEGDIRTGAVKLPPTMSSQIPDNNPNFKAPTSQPIINKPVDPTIAQQVIGAGEAGLATVTGATTGTIGMIGGTIKGVGEQLLNGEFGTRQAANAVEKAAMAGANAGTYQPRTPLGQERAEQVGNVMQQMVPLTPFGAELGTIGTAARAMTPIARAAGETVAPTLRNGVAKIGETLNIAKTADNIEPPGLGSVGAQGLNPNEVALNSVNSASPELQQAVREVLARKEEINLPALDRHIEADSLPVKVQLSEGQAIGDPFLISDEQNLRARQPEFAAHFHEQNNQLKESLTQIGENAAPDVFALNKNEVGERLVGKYRALDDALQADIGQKYKALRDAYGGEIPVDGKAFARSALNTLEDEGRAYFLPKEIRNLVDDYADGKKMRFKDFETMRTILAGEARKAERAGDGNAAYAVSVVRNALEDLPMAGENLQLKPLADAAREAAKARFQRIEADPAFKAVVNDNVSGDKFIQKYVIDADNHKLQILKSNLADNDAKQLVAYGVHKWLENNAIDSSGNFTQAGFNKALKRLRENSKLPVLFDPREAQQLQTLGKVAGYTQARPSGSYVNSSNTLTGALSNRLGGAAETLGNAALPGVRAGTLIKETLQNASDKRSARRALSIGAGISAKDSKLRQVQKKVEAARQRKQAKDKTK